jgi:DNA phosphorothioation-associated putative methyltransferase
MFAAQRIVGVLSYDIVKISTDGRAVSFLSYDAFDNVAHPPLTRSVRVYLPKASYEIREYGDRTNPPILHRKESVVLPTYPGYEDFRRLSEQEEALGLLSNPHIGTLRDWEGLLASRGLTIRGHRVVATHQQSSS